MLLTHGLYSVAEKWMKQDKNSQIRLTLDKICGNPNMASITSVVILNTKKVIREEILKSCRLR